MAPGHERAFELWHSHIHFSQKLASGTNHAGSRYIAADGSYFTLYEAAEASAFGPAGYTIPSPTLEADIAIRQQFTGFVRGVFVTRVSAGVGTAGWLATAGVTPAAGADLSALQRLVAALAGHDGIVQAELSDYDEATTTSFVLRLKPLPTLPAEPSLLLLRAIDEASLTAAIATLQAALVAGQLGVTLSGVRHFQLQHEFRK